MRYVIAMGFASAFALLAAVFLSGAVASTVVRQFTFDSPDSVANLHAAVFMGLNIASLGLGWVVGWAFGRRWADA
jgi:phosphate/sulfate permease